MNEETRIRHARPEELAEIMDIYAAARAFMAANGNAEQWSDGYPQKEVLQEDLKKERLYVYEEDGEIGAAFVFFIGEEPDYETFSSAGGGVGQGGTAHLETGFAAGTGVRIHGEGGLMLDLLEQGAGTSGDD